MSVYAILWGASSAKAERGVPEVRAEEEVCLGKRKTAESARAAQVPHLPSSLFCLLLSWSGLRQVMLSGAFVLQLQMQTSMICMTYQDVFFQLGHFYKADPFFNLSLKFIASK